MIRDLKWSHAEKLIARKAFDLALRRELEEVIRKAKDRATKLEDASGLWELERWLTQRRLAIERKYDYRYSVLPFVFANLLAEGRLSEDDLRDLGEEKFDLIRRIASRD